MDAGVGEAAVAEGAKSAGEASMAGSAGAAGTAAGEAAGVTAATGGGVGLTTAATGTGLTLSEVAAGASLLNAGAGLVTALSAKRAQAGIPAPGLSPRPVMPSPDDEAVRRARAAAVTSLQVRRGRQSTILDSAQSDLLGS